MGTGQGATIYVVDSGVRMTHQEFGDWHGGPSRAVSGYDFVDDDTDASDCDGHGKGRLECCRRSSSSARWGMSPREGPVTFEAKGADPHLGR